MPNIKETVKIIETTPVSQAILLEGIHGIGKSQILAKHFEEKGWRCVILFLGQMADAGDVIGLPDRIEDVDGIKKTIFCPPKWWPTDPEENVLVFLDELNRGNPEVMQCIMDMVLNRKLNGRDLPKNTRIVGAMNPITDDGFYKVDELDPAFLDRWNRYVFKPELNEWLDWALLTGLDEYVIGFITKRSEFLDPDTSVQAKGNDIQPSRRSWERVSDILKQTPELKQDLIALITVCKGIIGYSASSSFSSYIKEKGHGLTAGVVITSWKKEIAEKIKMLDIKELVVMNRMITNWLHEHVDVLKASEKTAAKYCNNIQKYLEIINPEAMAQFFELLSSANNNKQKWPSLVLELNDQLANKFFIIMKGQEEKRVN